MDAAIQVAESPDVIITTFGDMMKVPGTNGSLERAKAGGADVRVVFSPTESLKLAGAHPDKKVIFLAVGFETTVPSVASLIEEAAGEKCGNLFILSAHKLIPPAMKALLESGESRIDGFICPGHVSVIIGADAYNFIPSQYKVPCVVSGFEPVDILISIELLLGQLLNGTCRVDNEYRRAVGRTGNTIAQERMREVFEVVDAPWRGIGTIPGSGLKLRKKYARFDAGRAFGLDTSRDDSPKGCICGNVIKGVNLPTDCALFGNGCSPMHPVGPCMVSSEGSCAAFYKYGG
jgi:hydrogenase expression/formation protein HypD